MGLTPFTLPNLLGGTEFTSKQDSHNAETTQLSRKNSTSTVAHNRIPAEDGNSWTLYYGKKMWYPFTKKIFCNVNLESLTTGSMRSTS